MQNGEKAVAVAVESGRLETVEALLEAKANPNAVGKVHSHLFSEASNNNFDHHQNGRSATFTAVALDRVDVQRAVIGASAKLDLCSKAAPL